MIKPRHVANNFRSFSISALLLMASLLGQVSATAAPSFSKSFSPSTIGPGSTTKLSFIIENDGEEVPEPILSLSLAFTDVLPAGVFIATPANASTTCSLGTVSATDGGNSISLSSGSVGVSASCVVNVDVTSSISGIHTNTSGDLTSSAGNSGPATADLTVDTSRPGFSKAFSPATVPLGARSTLTFTIDNNTTESNAFDLNFTDNLPSGMVIADPTNASTTCETSPISAIVTASAGGNIITYNYFGINQFPAVAAGATCTVSVDVVGNAIGQLDNSSGELNSNDNSSGKANAALTVTGSTLSLVKSFVDDPVSPGSNVNLEFTISNTDRNNDATGIAFTDDLEGTLAGLAPAGMAPPNPCGDLSFAAGTLSFSNGSVAAGESCTLSLPLAVPGGSAAGAYPNTTSAISATIDGSTVTGNVSSDTLFVSNAPTLTKEFLDADTSASDPVINSGDDVVLRFTLTGATSAASNISFIDDITDLISGLGDVSLPPVPDPPCGAGSSLSLISLNFNRLGLQLTGGSLDAGTASTCSFDVTLTTREDLPSGIYLNTTEVISATVDGVTQTGKPASDTLSVITAPRLTKEFTDDPVAPGGTVTLEFTLSHSEEASGDATAITFTDDLAPVLTGLVATGLPLSDACDADGPGGNPSTGTLSGSAGDTLLTLAGATLSPGESCTISVMLTVPANAAPGDHTNTTSGVSATISESALTSAPAEDDLVISGLKFTKEFVNNTVLPGATTTLRFSIQNLHPTDDANITLFTDDLSAALTGLAATGPSSVDQCGGSLSGTTFLTYVGGSVLSGATCTIEVEVLVPAGAADGDYINVTGILSATQGVAVTVNPATDVLTVNSNLLQLTKSFTNDPVAPGGDVTLEFVITNLDATQPTSDIAFSDDLVSTLTGLTFDSLLFNDCGVTVAGVGTTDITVSGVSLAAGLSCTIRASLSVPGTAVAGIYTNTSSEIMGTLAGLPVNGAPASDNLEVTNLLLFSKSFDGPSTASGTTTLTFSITNPGNNSATGISFSDNLDNVISGLSAVVASLPAQPCGVGSSITGTNMLTFTGGSLPPLGGTCSFDVDLDIPATVAPGDYLNTTSDLTQQGLKVSDPATATLNIFIPDMDDDGVLDDDDNCPNTPIGETVDSSGCTIYQLCPCETGVTVRYNCINNSSFSSEIKRTAKRFRCPGGFLSIFGW